MVRREVWHFVPYNYDFTTSGHSDDIQLIRENNQTSTLPYGGSHGTKLLRMRREFPDTSFKEELRPLGISLEDEGPVEFYTLQFGAVSFAFLKLGLNFSNAGFLDNDHELERLRDILDSACFRNCVLPIFMVRSGVLNREFITVGQLSAAMKLIDGVEIAYKHVPVPETKVRKGETELIVSPYYAYGIGRNRETIFQLEKSLEEAIEATIGDKFSYNFKRSNHSLTFIIEMTQGDDPRVEKRRGSLIQLWDQFIFLRLPDILSSEFHSFPMLFNPSSLLVSLFLMAIQRELMNQYLRTFDDLVVLNNHMGHQDFDEKIITKANQPYSFMIPVNLLIASVNVRHVIAERMAILASLGKQYSEMKAIDSDMLAEGCKLGVEITEGDATRYAKTREVNEQIISKVTSLLPIFVLMASYEESKISSGILNSIKETSGNIQALTTQISAVQQSAHQAQEKASEWSKKLTLLSVLLSILAVGSVIEPFLTFYYGNSSDGQRITNLLWMVIVTLVPTAIFAAIVYAYFGRKK